MCALSEINSRSFSGSSPVSVFQLSNSCCNTHGSITIPSPNTKLQSGRVIPLGSKCNFITRSPSTTVCPALFPPWKRTTQLTSPASRSTNFPFPSSPHWAPSTTVAGMLSQRVCERIHSMKDSLRNYQNNS